MVSLGTARAKSRDARRISDIKNIQLALEEYYNDNLHYPLYLSSLAPTYIPSIPVDPDGTSAQSSGSPYYVPISSSSSCAGTNISNVTMYHLGEGLEIAGSGGTGNYSSDVDAAAGSQGTVCPGFTDFNGRQLNTTSIGCLTTLPQGAAGSSENCYDVTNQ
jgi:type II secretory pathway pseudopilin PulG